MAGRRTMSGLIGELTCQPFVLLVGRISSVGRVLVCRAGGRGFDSRGQNNTQGLKMTEK